MPYVSTETTYICDVCGATTRTVYQGKTNCIVAHDEELTDEQKPWMEIDLSGLGGYKAPRAEGVVCSQTCAVAFVQNAVLESRKDD